MTSQPPTGKPPQPTSRLPSQSAGSQGGSYVSHYKLQQQRIRALNQMENTASEIQKRIQQSLPKLQQVPGPDKENLVIRAVQRSNIIDAIKLPGVRASNPPDQPPAVLPRKKSLPMKTYHLRINPEHTSFISKSLPSLPSIPGSPSYPEEQAVSPLTDRAAERERAKVPVYRSKHRFEKIVFQKRIHKEQTDEQKDQEKPDDDTSKKRPNPQTTKGGHGGEPHWHHVTSGHAAPVKPHTSGSVRMRYSKTPREAVISETQSEPSFEVSRKWKDNCRCLRCQMLKRQFMEGDSQYGMWGRYPCHHIDPSIKLDD